MEVETLAGGGARCEVSETLRIANASGFYGDRFDAPREMLEGGPIDVLTGDYLAELTMLILWRTKQQDGDDGGYAKTFLRQMRDCLDLALARGVRVVVNAGGLNPAALAVRLRELAHDRGHDVAIAHVEGDDLLGRIDELRTAGHDLANLDTGEPLAVLGSPPLTANAYLGGWGIAAALDAGADIVVCPRVTDASLVVGPAAWRFGWATDAWDALAGAVVAGHVIECGAQATGGNYSFFREVPGLTHPGFPVAEVRADGTSVITKHEGTGGLVSVGTVTAQLLYEIGGPRYLNPDVVARFDTIELRQEGPDRVAIGGVRGEPAPDTTKVAINTLGGFRNEVTFLLTGLDIDAKAELLRTTIERQLDVETDGAAPIDLSVQLIRSDHPDAAVNAEAIAHLRVVARCSDPQRIGRRGFSGPLVELALASYPGFTMTAPPADASPYGVYWPAAIDKAVLDEVVVLPSGERQPVPQVLGGGGAQPAAHVDATSVPPPADVGPTTRGPLGWLVGARSGDKGGNANIGVWVRDPAVYPWLAAQLTAPRIGELIPEAGGLPTTVHHFPNLSAVNVVIEGLLDRGVSASTRVDPQAKGLGEYLRSRVVDLPVGLLQYGEPPRPAEVTR